MISFHDLHNNRDVKYRSTGVRSTVHVEQSIIYTSELYQSAVQVRYKCTEVNRSELKCRMKGKFQNWSLTLD